VSQTDRNGGSRIVLDFPHRRGGHCGTGSFRDLLEFHGLAYGPEPLSESMVMGLSGALTFMFAEQVVLPEAPGVQLPLYMNGRTETLESGVCATLGIALDLRRTDDPDVAWRWLCDELAAGRPTMVWANIGDLDYLDVKLDNTRHDVIVTGYDLREGVAYLADYDRDEIECCTLGSLARARASRAFPGPTRNATWVMRFPERLPDAGEAIRAALASVVANMRRLPGPDLPYEEGLRAVESFAATFPGWPERFGDGLRPVLKLLHVLIDRAGTGGSLFRRFFAAFLEEASELTGDRALREPARAYRELAGAWADLSRTVRRGTLDAHRAGAMHVERVAALEARGVRALEAWLAASDLGDPVLEEGEVAV
jgi:hypothetical protein